MPPDERDDLVNEIRPGLRGRVVECDHESRRQNRFEPVEDDVSRLRLSESEITQNRRPSQRQAGPPPA